METNANPHQPPTLIYIHIPKTGGTTIAKLLLRILPAEQQIRLNRRKREGEGLFQEFFQSSPERYFRVISGHFGYGLHKYLPNPSTYFTVLRHPIDRVVSDYYHGLNSKNLKDRFLEAGTDHPISVEEYAIAGKHSRNRQTRFLASSDVSFGVRDPCTPEKLAKAKERLIHKFPVFGILERFEESLLLLCDHLGYRRLPLYVRQNQNPDRVPIPALSPQVIAQIEAANEYDMQLYEFALDRFNRMVQAQPPDFRRRLWWLRKLNPAFSLFGGAYYEARARLKSARGVTA